MDLEKGTVLVALLLGIGFVLGPSFLHPGSGSSKITYEVEEIANESTAGQALGKDERTLECPTERPCALEERVLDEGSISYDGRVQRGQSYPVIQLDGDLYRPINEDGNGTTRLELEAISPMEAVERAAVPAETQRPEVRTAVRTGSVTVYNERIEAFEEGQIIRYNGSYYWNDGFRATGTRIGGVAHPLSRGVLHAIGIALLVYGGWTARTLAEREDTEERADAD